ncbi:ABC transporter permease, partial [Lactobacillus sp. XV13L]|nr:ABC transporter permease [Lactobacillus sp. XV13L]
MVYLKDTSQKGLDDALFFQEVDYILYLPATASAQLQAEQKVKFKTKVRPGTYSKEMVDQNINQYFNTLTIYHRNLAHASWPNILEKTQQTLQHQGKVRFDKSYQRHQQQQHTALDYNILAYGLFLVIFEAYSLVSLVFNRQAVKTRNLCSPLAPN